MSALEYLFLCITVGAIIFGGFALAYAYEARNELRDARAQQRTKGSGS